MANDNKRIASNTLFLYLRMVVNLAISFYTTRVVWLVLGVEDYGVFNVVGGVVLLFAFLKGAMVASSQRYISFALGQKDPDRLNRVFSISLTVHLLMALGVLVLAETAGLWFLNTQLVIPAGRMDAAHWVYQCAVAAFCVNIISVPYDSCIVAHERMKQWGYFGILETVLKLVIVWLLLLLPGDKLKVYALLTLGVSVVMRLLYQWYCRSRFDECRMRRVRDGRLLREMFAFTGWSFLGNFGFSVRDQGVNIIINICFGVAVNAARGLAASVGSHVSGFASSFQMAMNPQITKRYASGDTESMLALVFAGCRYSFMLLTLIAVPLYLAAAPVLGLWLDTVAPYTVGFTRLALGLALVESMAGPVTTALQATGRIRDFQIAISVIMLANLPLAWFWVRHTPDPYLVMVVCIAMSALGVLTRLYLLRRIVPYKAARLIPMFVRPALVLAVSAAASWWLYGVIPGGFWGLVAFAASSVCCTLAAAWAVGLKPSERSMALGVIRRRLKL